ncbi:conserved hypothetical protein [Echinococcus multilocularis]|uniref:Uncharacterized protein n=1 Tax=Echinococcus multilocularis TaxID=6211 RepID=A0A068Y4A9_ECHMU|nr:conserved hypothetical protein [Echinococcus multilocularis]
MASPKCYGVQDHALLAPPITEALDELHLSTVSLLANASSNPSGRCSYGSIERILDSPRLSSSTFPHPLFQQPNHDMRFFNQRPTYGSCSLLADVTGFEENMVKRINSCSLNLNTFKQLRHNSASPKSPDYPVESRPLKFNAGALDNLDTLVHPKPCYVLHVNMMDKSIEK